MDVCRTQLTNSRHEKHCPHEEAANLSSGAIVEAVAFVRHAFAVKLSFGQSWVAVLRFGNETSSAGSAASSRTMRGAEEKAEK